MRPDAPVVAALNVGSSSLKFALFGISAHGRTVRRLVSGNLDRIGSGLGSFDTYDGAGALTAHRAVRLVDHEAAVREFLAWLACAPYGLRLFAVGHRVVHGGLRYVQPQVATPRILRDLHKLVPLDPDHLPAELRSIQILRRARPATLQVACFDTAFHRRMPRLAQVYALPRDRRTRDVVRFGFHGLSCEYVLHALSSLRSTGRPPRRLIVAHLGNGCSLTAVREGRSVDTTMGFTPTGGVMMSTRPGDLDPGVVVYLSEHPRRTPEQLRDLLNRESGLLGVSGTSSDMRDLLAHASRDPRAREAVDLFCYQVRKSVGALTAVLGGLDVLVFTGGIGERSGEVRRRICGGLAHLGIAIDPRRNARNGPVVSSSRSAVQVRVVPTDEEWIIALHALRVWRRYARGRSRQSPRPGMLRPARAGSTRAGVGRLPVVRHARRRVPLTRTVRDR